MRFFARSSFLLAIANAIVLNVSDEKSIIKAAHTAAWGLQAMYTGNKTGGVLGKWSYPPFYWWESGAAWGGMMNYWVYTGDSSWYYVTYEGLMSQISPTYNYLPDAEKFDEGNDDVGFWAFGALTAAETGFKPPAFPYPSWLQVNINIFNDFITRWNNASATCGGGLRWQVFESSPGYYYKNSISNACFFQIAARLYRLTEGKNETYLLWANKVWDWTVARGLLDTKAYAVYDGADEKLNCTSLDHTQWSYNVATYLAGASVLSNFTGNRTWTERAVGLTMGSQIFHSPFPNATNVIYEQQCEKKQKCNIDQYSFKAYLVRWLSETAVLVPQTRNYIVPILEASAVGAARACTGGNSVGFNLNICGARWYWPQSDGTSGLGQALAAMEVFYSLLVVKHPEKVPMVNASPATNNTHWRGWRTEEANVRHW